MSPPSPKHVHHRSGMIWQLSCCSDGAWQQREKGSCRYFCMSKRNALFALCLNALVLGVPVVSSAQQGDGTKDANEEITGRAPPVLWREPTDFASRNLLLGPGGEKHQPHGTFTFVKEDLEGTNPKFV